MSKRVWRSLKAMGGKPLPEQIEAGGNVYTPRKTFKDDFFAVTSMYEGPAGKVILKINRKASFFLIPLSWTGWILANRERACFKALEGVRGVPRLLGNWGRTGVIREYVEGHAMRKGERVPDDFHANLRKLVLTMHDRGLAYVDLEKCENVLVGDDNKPHLFDFQISWCWPASWGGNLWPIRKIRGLFQRADLYHLVKLQRRTRPDQLSQQEREDSYKKPGYVRWFGLLTKPLRSIRRSILDRIDPRRNGAERGRVENDDGVEVS